MRASQPSARGQLVVIRRPRPLAGGVRLLEGPDLLNQAGERCVRVASNALGFEDLTQPRRQRGRLVEVQHLQRVEEPVQGVKMAPILAHPRGLQHVTSPDGSAPAGQTRPTALWGLFTIDLVEVRRQLLVHGWSMADLAQKVLVSVTTTRRFLRGLPVRPRSAYRLITTLGLKPDVVITVRESVQP